MQTSAMVSSTTALAEPWELRARFARELAAMYGREVPAYTALVEATREVNELVVAQRGAEAERLGTIGRVSEERHGAIRLGTPRELAQAARVFGAMGMYPVGYYDLRDAAPTPVPVVSTAFRPIAEDELARNPFRVFTSVLAVSDRRFFSAELAQRLERFLAARELFPPELLALADRSERQTGLAGGDAERFVELATAVFALSNEPVNAAWYRELEAISSVAADIGGVSSTHINHLTPRVLDIDELYARMQRRGLEMIETIQGPPRWDGPDVLLRQTSFRALAEPRRFTDADGHIFDAELRVRFGEVEARGIALTPTGRQLYDDLGVETAARQAQVPAADRGRVAASCWEARFPRNERALAAQSLGYFRFTATAERVPGAEAPPAGLPELLAGGWMNAEPIVYEDFLPRSAAGIFQSNLGSAGAHDTAESGAELGVDWMAGVLDRELRDPFQLYAAQRQRSWAAACGVLGIDPSTHFQD
jgi:uncharacterized glyoxalase superfamily metalloenzyme YdcJ